METSQTTKKITAKGNLYDPMKRAKSLLFQGLSSLFIGFLFLILPSYFFEILRTLDLLDREVLYLGTVSLDFLGILLVISSILFLLMYYLRYGFQLPLRENFSDGKLDTESVLMLETFESKFAELSERHSKLLDKIEVEPVSLNDNEREALIKKIHDGITDQASADILQSIEEKYAIDVTVNSNLSLHYKETTGRLKSEIEHLSRRSNTNLAFGSLVAVIGIIILGAMLFSENFDVLADLLNAEINYIDFTLTEFVPRLSLVLLIEFFAYFFLRLYKISLDEIKFFQNELTNIESKFVGIEVAILSKDIKLKKAAIDSFVKTERNFVLKKGETTVELEKSRIESSNLEAGLKSVSNIISGAKK